MRLYHPGLLAIAFIFFLASCSPVQAPQTTIAVNILTIDDKQELQVPQGSSVEEVIRLAGLELSELDRTEPPLYSILTDGSQIQVIRVSEEFEIEQVIIPYESRTLRNEGLPEGERRLVQAGVNGLQEITYRRLYENNTEVSRTAVKSVIVREPAHEIVMIGAQSPFAPVVFPGRIAYLVAGNAWILDGVSGERQPVVTTGDLDGRVFSLSGDGDWLLFTRKSEIETEINSLWVAKLDDSGLLIDLEARNIIHFAGWVPNAVLQVAYSTVEPRSTAPGWQANNNLVLVSFSPTGWVSDPELVLDANAGGVYGWWGTNFVWSPDGTQLAFARPDGVGLVNFETTDIQKLFDIAPLQTFGDWAWVPGLSWSPDQTALFSVDHPAQDGSASAENSPNFDVAVLPLLSSPTINLVSQAGMFAYPVPSQAETLPTGEIAYQVAYLQAIFPSQSETSRYLLMVMDRDGSNRKQLFPESGAPGLDPQRVVWTPVAGSDEDSYDLAFIYQGNLWLVNTQTGLSRQLSGDGLVSRIDWK